MAARSRIFIAETWREAPGMAYASRRCGYRGWASRALDVVPTSWAADETPTLKLVEVELAADEEATGGVVGVELAGQLVRSSHVRRWWTEPRARGFMLLDDLLRPS